MVDWRLVRRAGARYTLAYGGGTAALAAATGRGIALLLLVLVGLALLVFVAGGVGTVRAGTLMTNGRSMGTGSTITDATENGEFRRAIDADLKLLFYAAGLLAFGSLAMVIVG